MNGGHPLPEASRQLVSRPERLHLVSPDLPRFAAYKSVGQPRDAQSPRNLGGYPLSM